jgi:predicted lipid-binding transport protein (Tim44 family)
MEGRWWSDLLGRRRAQRSGARHEASAAGSVSAMNVEPAAAPRGYSPKNVGNDASARPWESLDDASSLAAAPQRADGGFDAEGFLHLSKTNFLSLQDAWDRSDVGSLRAMMTDGMLAQIQSQLSERERSGAGASKTEVVMLEAQLLGLEEQDGAYLASVEFSGLIREEPSAGPNPFREIWNITRPKAADDGWLVAGVQALQ